MAKRGYKLQEFVAHAGNVNCLTFGKKNCRVFITGGDDQKVNLWSVGKPTSLMSLCGHTSPIESAAFDSAEILVVAGSSSGAIKLWDLEETKMVRTLTGHRSYCTAVEFHPFGEFFASGSMDTNLKIWDIRKKGCIHTYKGHTRGISTIRFTPDGRWVVSGGFDNVVKIWDLTAGKLLHDFKFHEGHIRSIEFHPLEFLLATGSADKTVKFWDLETFEMIGSARREATGVRSLTFHPDGRTLFCGLDDSLKVYSWEPVICHDSVDMGWSTVGDLCIHEGKLLGGAYYENSVAVWVADVSLLEPYGTRSAPEPHSQSEQKCESQESLLEKEECHVKSKSNLRAMTPDSESKEIKTIYVDRVNSITSKTVDTIDVPKVVQPADSSEISSVGVQKCGSVASLPSSDSMEIGTTRTQKHAPVSSLPSSDSKEISTAGIQKRALVSSLPSSDSKEISTAGIQKRAPVSSLPSSDSKEISTVGIQKHAHVSSLPLSDSKEISAAGIKKGAPVSSLPLPDSKEIISTGIQKCAPVSSLPPSDSKEVSTTGIQKHGHIASLPPSDSKEIRTTRIQKRGPGASFPSKANVPAINRSLVMPSIVPRDSPDGKYSVGSRRESIASSKPIISINAKPSHTRRLSGSQFDMRRMSESLDSVPSDNMKTPLVSRKDSNQRSRLVTDDNAKESSEGKQANNNTDVDKFDRTSLPATTSIDQSLNSSKRMNPVKVVNGVAVVHGRTRSLVERFERKDKLDVDEVYPPDRASNVAAEPVETPPSQSSDQKIVSREQPTSDGNTSNLVVQQISDQKVVLREQLTLDDNNIIENLMENHDVLLSTFRSRLTKLQVVRHFWERNDVKGAINAVRKLPDFSMQADVVGALTERMEIFTLELFSCLLPVLYGLLESKTERHATLSLEMLLKLVAVFGSVVNSAVSAPPSVGVDLHAEERKCFDHLQNIQRTLPELVRRGGNIARCAQQLNMVLLQT